MPSPSRVSTPQTRRRGQPRGRSKGEPRETTPPIPRGVGGKGGAKTESGSSPVTYAAAASSAVASPFISGGGGAASDQTGGSKTPGSSPAFSAASPSTASAAPHGGAPAAPPGGTSPGSEPITIDGRAYVGSFAIDLVFFHILPQAEKDSIQLLRRLTTTPPSYARVVNFLELIYSIGRSFIRVTPPIIDAVMTMPSSTFQEVGAFLLQCTGTPLNVVPALGTILERGFEAARLTDLLTMGIPCDGPTTSRNAQSLTDSDQKWVDGKRHSRVGATFGPSRPSTLFWRPEASTVLISPRVTVSFSSAFFRT